MEFKYTNQFQKKIISVALASEINFRNMISIIEPFYFTVPICKTTWKIIKYIYEKHLIKPSIETIIGLLSKTQKFSQDEIDNFYDTLKNTNNSDESFVVNEIYDFCKQANFFLVINQYIDAIGAGKCNWDELYLKLNNVFSLDYNKSYIGVDYFNDLEKHKKISRNMGREGLVPTGFPIDQFLNGGLGKKEVGIIIAPTGRGKSTILLNFALGALFHNKNVLFVSCELAENYLVYKLDKCLMYTITGLFDFIEEDLILHLKKIREKIAAKLIIKEVPPGELTTTELYNIVRDLATKNYNFDLIIVDYLGEMKLPKADREDLAYKKLTTQLSKLSKILNVPIWTAHQTGKGSHDKAVLGPKDISDAFSILRVVDVGLTLSATEEEFANGESRLLIIKNRFGPINEVVNLKVLMEVSKFIAMDQIDNNKDSKIIELIKNK